MTEESGPHTSGLLRRCELASKVYRGRKISIIEDLKARLITAANGNNCSTDALPEQQDLSPSDCSHALQSTELGLSTWLDKQCSVILCATCSVIHFA